MKSKFSKTCISVAVALICTGGSSVARGQTMDELRAEMKLLREEINALKKQNIAATIPPAERPVERPVERPLAARVTALETKSTQMLLAGDAEGSLILPGSKTSLRVFGQAEVHAIHDIKQSGVSDFFTNLTFQPLNRENSPKGHSKITAESSRFGIETSTPLKVGSLTTKLEADFYAYSADTRNRLRLRQAYGEMGNWLIGLLVKHGRRLWIWITCRKQLILMVQSVRHFHVAP